jgi:hypothetical protein
MRWGDEWEAVRDGMELELLRGGRMVNEATT